MSEAKYLELAELANKLTEFSLNTDRGPITVRFDEGELALFDFDGRYIGAIEGREHD